MKNDLHEFHPLNVEIEERPINPIGRFLMWFVFSIFFISCLWLYFGKMDIVVSAKGTVIPLGEIKVVQPIERGVISGIFVKEGDFVKKGDLLIQIDPTVVEVNLDTKEKRLNLLGLQKDRLKSIIEDTLFLSNSSPEGIEETSIYNYQLNYYKDNLNYFENQLKQLIVQLNSLKVEKEGLREVYLFQTEKLNKLKNILDIIAKKDFYDLERESFNTKNKIDIQVLKIKELEEKVFEISSSLSKFKNEFKDKKYEEFLMKDKEFKELKAEIEGIKFQNKKQYIVSSVDGYISKIMVSTIGGVVDGAEKLMNIVPVDSKLIVKADFLNQDIGFIQKGMSVKIKSDTFNFQKYGFYEGEVINVGSFSIEDEKKGSIYEVKILPSDKTLNVEGVERRLEPGMSVLAEVKVGKRRIIEFFVYPLVQYWDEGLSVK